jgi:hypothetical protein
MTIIGSGNKAVIKDVSKAVVEVSSIDQVDFANLARFNY